MNLMNECRKTIQAHFFECDFTYHDVIAHIREKHPNVDQTAVRATCRLLCGRGELDIVGKKLDPVNLKTPPINIYKVKELFDKNKPRLTEPRKPRDLSKIKAWSTDGMFLLALRAGDLDYAQIEERFGATRPQIKQLMDAGFVERYQDSVYRITELGRKNCPTRR